MPDWDALLRRYNPSLVIFPHDTTLRRPGARNLGAGRTWGDYHPCCAEFFLDRVSWRSEPVTFEPRRLPWQHPADEGTDAEPIGLVALRDKTLLAQPAETSLWELDVAKIPSRHEPEAWRAYGEMIAPSARGHPFECVVYSRHAQGPSGHALQYWYLYIYNDFGNNHEGDWEMAAIHVDDNGIPIKMGVSSHFMGSRLPWRDVPQEVDHLGVDHPLFYVARGSHANYFAYKREGYDAIARGINTGIHLPTGIAFLEPALHVVPLIEALPGVRSLPFVKDWHDHVPALAGRDDGLHPPAADLVPSSLRPQVQPMPEIGDAGDGWWRRLDAKWGSRHSRLSGRIGPDSPWKQAQHEKWDDPVAWIDECIDEAKKPEH